jgi:hypothetical protein
MKNLKPYNLFESAENPQRRIFTKLDLNWLNRCTTGEWNYNPATGKIDIKGDFACGSQNLTDFKGIEFGTVTGSFDCGNNDITSLKGAPNEVGESFYCDANLLTSLEDGPNYVSRTYDCNDNQLKSLIGAPEYVGRLFSCSSSELVSLEGLNPQYFKGDIHFDYNPVEKEVLEGLAEIMRDGTSYIDALFQLWPEMAQKDRELTFEAMKPNMTPEEIKRYEAIAIYSKYKGLV